MTSGGEITPGVHLWLLDKPRLLLLLPIMDRMYQVDDDIVLLYANAIKMLPHRKRELLLRLPLLPLPARHGR